MNRQQEEIWLQRMHDRYQEGYARGRDDAKDELTLEIKRLQELLRGIDANRYWEGRWRDEKAEVERLQQRLRKMDCEAQSGAVGAVNTCPSLETVVNVGRDPL